MACIITYKNNKYSQQEFEKYFKNNFNEFVNEFLSQDVEGFKEYMKSQQKSVSLPMNKTKKDIIDNIELYKDFIGNMTAEDIQNADSNTIAEILKKICK